MQIRRNSWHYKMYQWHTQRSYHSSVNLCPYVRTVMFWAPLSWLFVKGRFGWMPVPPLSIGSIMAAVPAFFWLRHKPLIATTISGAYLLAGIFIGIILGCQRWAKHAKQRRLDKILAQMTEDERASYEIYRNIPDRFIKRKEKTSRIQEWAERAGEGISDFFELLGAFLKAIHHKVCPVLEVENPQTKQPTKGS